MRTKLTVAALAVFGLLLAGAPAFAQGAKVTIPFAFTAMGKTLPAGTYQMSEESPDVIRIQSVETPSIQFFLPILDRLAGSNATGGAQVVFDRRGAKDALAQIWLDDDDGYVVAMPKR